MPFIKTIKLGKFFGTLIVLCAFSLNSLAEEIKASDDLLFKGIIKQSHDNTCGIAALSTLVNGIIENAHITEDDVINAIKTSPNDVGDEGYSLKDLQKASEKLGYPAQWRKINQTVLPKIKQPVILLIGLNTDFPHFVVLKGIENGEAFLADPIRGNIRTPYQQLIAEGINEKYSGWYVMAINPSANKPKDSALYLSPVESERIAHHMTAEQSNIITLTTVARLGQIIVDYGFNATLGDNQTALHKTNVENYGNTFYASYGITETSEIGGSISYDLNRQNIENKKRKNNTDNLTIVNGEQQSYALFFKNRFQLDNANNHGIIAGLRGTLINARDEQNTSINDYSVYGASINTMYYYNTGFAQLIAGGVVSKQFSAENQIDDVLPEYEVTGYVSANKPFANRYLASVGFAVNDGHHKSSATGEFERSYSVSASVSYVLSKKIQISPSFNYSFGNGEFFTFGLDIAYVGRW